MSYPVWAEGLVNMVMVKVLDFQFELQSRYYVHFRINTLGEGMNSFILLEEGMNSFILLEEGMNSFILLAMD